ncbi:hypothetical protein HHI36_006931 [Cryptolaemus montrouzieri]|uniref:HTH psq-type domain-containing protein n=1 Tax=Cryptolaemus montrouzieri TaxID=559131 RepID=A0ABD2MNI3_9CUCU
MSDIKPLIDRWGSRTLDVRRSEDDSGGELGIAGRLNISYPVEFESFKGGIELIITISINKMPIFYETKPGSNARHPVPHETIGNAVKEVVIDRSGLRRTADEYGIDKMTVRRLLSNIETILIMASKPIFPKFTTKQIFDKDEEDMLASHLKKASQLHHGLETIGARQLAYKSAIRNTKSYSAK